MPESQLLSALFTTAFLSNRKDINHHRRSRIVSCVPAFDIYNLKDVAGGLVAAFKKAGSNLPSSQLPNKGAHRKLTTLAVKWKEQGIHVIPINEIQAQNAQLDRLPPIFFAKGDLTLFNESIVTVLNSRTGRRITPEDEWLIATKHLFRLATESCRAIVTSYGNASYELLAGLAQAHKLPILVVCPDILPFMEAQRAAKGFVSEYESLFDGKRALYVSPFSPGPVGMAGDRAVLRDQVVASLASHILVGAVREKGNMYAILETSLKRQIPITVYLPDKPGLSTAGNLRLVARGVGSNINSVSLPQVDAYVSTKGRSDNSIIRPSKRILKLRNWPAKGETLIHYTRSCPGPWPGQARGEYYQSLIDGAPLSSHSAFHTLLRILDEMKVRASRRFVRGQLACVSFTECEPSALKQLMKWRKGLIRWSFEPYGIAFPKQMMVNAGAQRVVYGEEKDFQRMPEERKYLFQLQTEKGEKWSLEREWRIVGDIDLNEIPKRELTVIVPELKEARIIQEKYDYQVTIVRPDSIPE